MRDNVNFAAASAGTGLYVSLSCAYHTDGSDSIAVELLGEFGNFQVQSVGGCPSDPHIVATHPSSST